MPKNLRNKVMEGMRAEMPAQGPITKYLAWMRTENPSGADSLEADVIETFSSPEGLRVLKLLEKSVLKTAEPLGSPASALLEANAMRILTLEIRRIVSHGG